MFEITQNEGEFLVRLARGSIVTYLRDRKEMATPKDTPPKLREKSGVFVTLSDVKLERSLRGCIGYPLPHMELVKATIHSAIEAATGDPRFPPVTLKEFNDRIAAEVSVLTTPTQIQVKHPREFVGQTKVGRDGLVIEKGSFRGLLLPQVPVECKWDEEEFICQCCIKAGLAPDAWLLEGTKVYKFQAIVYEEDSPNGNVKLKELTPEETE
ncbi:MAG: TIGR00296 family protein [archaeon]